MPNERKTETTQKPTVAVGQKFGEMKVVEIQSKGVIMECPSGHRDLIDYPTINYILT